MIKMWHTVMISLVVTGAVIFGINFLGIIDFPDIIEMYSLCGITVGVAMTLITTDYYTISSDLQEKMKMQQYQVLTKKAIRDQKREERRYQKSLRTR